MTIEEHIIANDVLREVNELLENQTVKGLVKYGTTINPDDYTLEQWIDHAREELVDTLVYLRVIKRIIKERSL